MPEVDKIRSAEKEADLDKKIEDIRRRNELLEQRHKLVIEEAKQNGVPKSFQKATAGNAASNGTGGGNAPKSSSNNHTNLKTSETIPSPNKKVVNGIESKGNQQQLQQQQKQWSREWDRGKTSAEEWKMNVPEFGDHGNSYFKTAESNNAPNGNSTRGGRGGRGGGFQARGNGRRPNPTTNKNPGFFHDDRCDKNKNEENPSATNSVSDGKNESSKKATIPPRNNNFPRKQQYPNHNGTTTPYKNENDRNQNDSNKPNMNITSSGGPRQDRRGGNHSAAQPLPSQRNAYQSRRPFQSGGPTNSKPQTNGAPQTNGEPNGANFSAKVAPRRNEIQRKPISTKDDENKLQQNNGSENPSGPSNRGRNFKPYGKPTTGYNNNPRQNKAPSKTHATSGSGAGAKPQSPKLDKDGQAVKRLIDNVIDQVVRQERKEQQKKSGEEEITVKDVTKNNEKSEESKNEKIVETKKEKLEENEIKKEEKIDVTKIQENQENFNKNETKLETSAAAEEPKPKESEADEAKLQEVSVDDEPKKDGTGGGDSPSPTEEKSEISKNSENPEDPKHEATTVANEESKVDEKPVAESLTKETKDKIENKEETEENA